MLAALALVGRVPGDRRARPAPRQRHARAWRTARLGGMVWLTPIALVAAGAAVALILWELRGHRSTRGLLAVRRLPALAAAVDWPGAVLLGLALATIIVSFSAEDPSTGAISPAALWLLPLGALAAAGFVVRERRARHPLIAAAELRSRGAYGALLDQPRGGSRADGGAARHPGTRPGDGGPEFAARRRPGPTPSPGRRADRRRRRRLALAASRQPTGRRRRDGDHRGGVPGDDGLDGDDACRSLWTRVAASERPRAGRLRPGLRPGDRPGQRIDAGVGARAACTAWRRRWWSWRA